MTLRTGVAALLLLCSAAACDSPQTREPASESNGVAVAAPQTGPPRPVMLAEKDLADGWISLFDGQTLFGWKAFHDADWRVEDGALVVSRGEKGLLCTTTRFGDYQLRLEFRAALGTNSGIFLRTPGKPEDPTRDCYELNIAPPDNPFPTGSLVGRQKVEGAGESDEWREYDVTVEGPRVVVKLDGRELLRYEDPQPLGRGYIGLQLNEGEVAFRNIRLRPLGLESIFNGRDLDGWKTYPDMAGRFTVEDGLLRVRNGRGQLESAATYGDFVLQLECRTHAPNLNSGVFFRCIPGEQMNGYESQIHNGFDNGDRRQPTDHGTGGIFRRAKARQVVADDETWFYKTLIADGPHMAVWVNGYPVTDWVDDRPPHDNPRQGLRLEAGTLMLQAHDPTTDLSFRNLRARELR